jgi:amidase
MPVPESLDVTIGRSGLAAPGVTMAGLQRALGAGELSSAELTAFYLERIGRLNPDLHAVISVSGEAAAAAAASDAARASGAARGPLEGIPVLIKDNIAAAGLPATAAKPTFPSGQTSARRARAAAGARSAARR